MEGAIKGKGELKGLRLSQLAAAEGGAINTAEGRRTRKGITWSSEKTD